MTNLTPDPTMATATVTSPDDGEDITAVASGAGKGPIRPALQALLDRAEYLYQRSGGWPAAWRAYSIGNEIVYSVGGYGPYAGVGTYTPAGLGNDTWYYLYGYLNAGAWAVEHSTTAPYMFDYTKDSDPTRRYITTFRTDGSGNLLPFWLLRGHYRWLTEASSLLTTQNIGSVTWASVALKVPNHARMAHVRVTQSAADVNVQIGWLNHQSTTHNITAVGKVQTPALRNDLQVPVFSGGIMARVTQGDPVSVSFLALGWEE